MPVTKRVGSYRKIPYKYYSHIHSNTDSYNTDRQDRAMKFGDFIENHLVPEWRSQYLDYFKGKAKLHKLEKFLLTSTECQCETVGRGDLSQLQTSGVHDADDGEGAVDNDDFHSMLSQNHEYPDKGRTRSKADYQLHNELFPSSTTAALKDARNQEETDYDEDEDEDDLGVVPLIDKLDYGNKRKLGETTPLIETAASHLSYTKPNNSHPVGHHRSHSTSILYIRDQRASLTSEHRDIIELAKQRFIEWVDIELLKVNSFYKSKELECTTRFIVLLDQLDQLKYQEVMFKKANTTSHNENPTESSSQQQSPCLHHRTNNDSNNNANDITNNRRRHLTSIFNPVSILERVHFIFNYFEMPTFPSYYWRKSVLSRHNSDSSNMDDDETSVAPPPFISRIMIKKAICELYHTVELLSSFRVVNRTAFRKLIKKYDKRCHDSRLPAYMRKVDAMYFNTSDVLSKLTENIEDVFTASFEEGHRKTAITNLRSFANTKSHYRSNFISGYLIGVSCPLIIFFLVTMYSRAKSGSYPEQKYVLQLWGSWFLFVMAGLLFALNCVVWDKYKINYKLVFELNPNDALDYKQYMIIPSVLLFLGSLIAFASSTPNVFSFLDFEYYPYMYFYSLLFILFCPFNIFHLKARIWFIVSIFRLFLSGFYPVEFRDFFMGVLTCSLTYSIANIYMLFCLQNDDWNNCITCGPMKSHILGLCACIPPLWRSMQCLRRFLDTGEWFPHFANLAKYLITTFYFYILSLYRIGTYRDMITNSSNSSQLEVTTLFITVSTVNSAYSSFWDVCMDWSLMQLSSDNYLLRDVLIYKRKLIYYFAIAFDIILRFQWVVYVFTPYRISHSALTAFCVAVAELVRRFVWMFFRMENEHATNVNLFRVSRVCPLPYSYTNNSIINSKTLSQFAEKHLKISLQALFKQSNTISPLDIEDVEDIEDTLDDLLPSMANNSSTFTDLESSQRDANDILQHDNDVVSIYSSATQHTSATVKQSGWQQLSKIISRAHTKEFQQRNNQTSHKRSNNLSDSNTNAQPGLDEELDMVADSNGVDALTEEEEDDGSGGSIASM